MQTGAVMAWPAEIACTLNAAFGSKQGLEDQHALSGAPLFVPDTWGTMTARMFNALGARAVEEGALLPISFGAQMSQPQTDVAQVMQVRRLTPVECERLQGFPDGYTAIPWGKKQASECPDGPRYKALGNSMAVLVMRWIGERIQAVEAIK